LQRAQISEDRRAGAPTYVLRLLYELHLAHRSAWPFGNGIHCTIGIFFGDAFFAFGISISIMPFFESALISSMPIVPLA